MGEQARVTSVDALELFRGRLVLFQSASRAAIDEASAEVLRTRLWLENEQEPYWELQVKRRTRALEEAQSALFSSRLSTLREVSAAEQMAVRRAKAALEEARLKLAAVKKWQRRFPNDVEPLLKQTERLQSFLTHDLNKALATLTRLITQLSAYTDSSTSPQPAPPSNPLPDSPRSTDPSSPTHTS